METNVNTERVIHKYHFPIQEEFTLPIPPQHEIVLVELQDGIPTMWVEIKPSPTIHKSFSIIGTGHAIPPGWSHVRSFQQAGYVWHLYEKVEEI